MTRTTSTSPTGTVEAVCVQAATELRRRGGRLTEPRRAVIEVLASTTDHLSAAQVAERAQRIAAGLHLASVYRAVDALARLGLLEHTHLPGGSTTYHLSTPASPRRHVHAQCSRCGTVIDVPEEWLAEVGDRLADRLGFRLAAAHAALVGTCADCAASTTGTPHDH